MNEHDLTTMTWAAKTARAEHGELHQLLDAARNEICGCLRLDHPQDQQKNCLHNALRKLRDHMAAHFAHEEAGGWLEEAVVQAPFLAHQLTMLEKQHVPLRERANRLVALAGEVNEDAKLADTVKEEFERLAQELLAHEAEEERILRQGLNEELDL